MSFLGSCFAFYQPTFHWRCTFWLRKSAIVTWRARRPVADPQSWKIGVTLDTDDAHLQFHHVETGLPQRRTLRGLPRSDLDHWLQSVINAAARLTVGAQLYDHITPLLTDLHWLPMPQRIQYACVLAHYCDVIHGSALTYLKHAICPRSWALNHGVVCARRRQWISLCRDMSLNMGDWLFLRCRLSTFMEQSLPDAIRHNPSPAAFKLTSSLTAFIDCFYWHFVIVTIRLETAFLRHFDFLKWLVFTQRHLNNWLLYMTLYYITLQLQIEMYFQQVLVKHTVTLEIFTEATDPYPRNKLNEFASISALPCSKMGLACMVCRPQSNSLMQPIK